jgi:hypothetical protein
MYIKMIILLACFAVIIYFIKQIFSSKKVSQIGKQQSSNNNSSYLVKNDPNAQIVYEKKKVGFFSLGNVKDKLELSWQFLYEITEIVLKKFSSQDRMQVNEIGKKLFNAGMQYDHVIDYGINRSKINQQVNDKNKPSQNINR